MPISNRHKRADSLPPLIGHRSTDKRMHPCVCGKRDCHLSGTFSGPRPPLVRTSEQATETCSVALQDLLRKNCTIELAGYPVITTLIDLMIEAVRYPDKAYSKLLINRISKQYDVEAPTLYGKIQAVLDYISGMTSMLTPSTSTGK